MLLHTAQFHPLGSFAIPGFATLGGKNQEVGLAFYVNQCSQFVCFQATIRSQGLFLSLMVCLVETTHESLFLPNVAKVGANWTVEACTRMLLIHVKP